MKTRLTVLVAAGLVAIAAMAVAVRKNVFASSQEKWESKADQREKEYWGKLTRWEYRVVEVEPKKVAGSERWERMQPNYFGTFEHELRQLGGEGWELVSSFMDYETVYPDINAGMRERMEPQMAQRLFPEMKMPNVRGAKMYFVFKRPSAFGVTDPKTRELIEEMTRARAGTNEVRF
jgi:hypothetical protein